MYYVYSDELAHHGIKGQRWGIRRWQNPDGTLTEAGKRRYGTAENLKAGKTLKQVQKEKEEKENLITSGNAALVKKNASKLTDEEFQRALSRLDKQKKLDDINTGFVENAKKKFESVKGMIDSVAVASTKVVETYNTVANVVNAINPDAKWKKIGDKTLSVEDQQKAYNLKKQKEKDQRTAQVEEIFKKHGSDLNWVREHANEFSKDELESFFARANALGALNDPNESWRKENRQGNNNKNQNQQSKKENKQETKQQPKQENNQQEQQPKKESKPEPNGIKGQKWEIRQPEDKVTNDKKQAEENEQIVKGWQVYHRIQAEKREQDNELVREGQKVYERLQAEKRGDDLVNKGREVYDRLRAERDRAQTEQRMRSESRARVIKALNAVNSLPSGVSSERKGQAFISSLFQQNGGFISSSDAQLIGEIYPTGEAWIKRWLNSHH